METQHSWIHLFLYDSLCSAFFPLTQPPSQLTSHFSALFPLNSPGLDEVQKWMEQAVLHWRDCAGQDIQKGKGKGEISQKHPGVRDIPVHQSQVTWLPCSVEAGL
jgi:hypothetical protein